MVSSSFVWSVCFCFFFILIGHPLVSGQQDPLYHYCSNERGNYTANSTYKTNLNHLLSTLTSDHQIEYGFYNLSYGEDDTANAIGLCRGDIKPNICRGCLNDSITLLTGLCPNQKEASLWYDMCMLRYSNRSLLGFFEDNPSFYMWNIHNASDQILQMNAAESLLGELKNEAASGDSRMKFATGNSTPANLPTLYGLVQCTPDLSLRHCDNCLYGEIEGIRNSQCYGKRGCRIVRSSCNIRYESYLFFEVSTPPPSPPPTDAGGPAAVTTNTHKEGNKTNSSFPRIVIILVPIVVTALILLTIGVCIFSRSRKPMIEMPERVVEDEITDVETLQFDFNTIRIATDEFSDANKLGEGGFGAVYKGTLPNGQIIAVKRLSRVSSQGDIEFKNEVLIVAKLQHRNLVRLLGFCLKQNEKLLIYEFVENSSLEKFIFDPNKDASLNWETRYKIIGGIARGLVYLHEDSRLRIIHRDLKASNILLDAEMNAKIADFGSARLFVADQTQGDTSRIVGTYGYMAPEYAMRGHFSVKSDVFSYGVLILEVVSGKKNNHVINNDGIEDLINYVWRNWREGTVGNIIDSRIESGSRTEMARCIHIGLLCVQENLGDRPTMTTVLLMLNSYSVTLPRPSQPAFFMSTTSSYSNRSFQWNDNSHVTNTDLDQSKDRSNEKSLNDASISELYPR